MMERKDERKKGSTISSGSDSDVDASSRLTRNELKKNRFFEDLSEREIGQLLKACTVHAFSPGEYVIREAELSRDLFAVLSGKVLISKTLYAGDEKELGTIGPGEFFGEIAFLDGGPRSANVSCVEEATLLQIDRIMFEKLAVRRPDIAYKVTTKIALTLAERLRTSTEMVEGFFSNPNRAILEFKTRLLKIRTMLQMM